MSGIRLDAVLSLDPRRMTSVECSVAIALGAAAFAFTESLCHLLLRSTLRKLMHPKGVSSDVKAQREAESTVTQVIVRLVSTVHNAIQVPVAVLVLSDAGLAGNTIYGASALSSFMVLCSAAYFFYDLLQVLYRFKNEGMAMLIHAMCCLFVYGYAVYSLYLHYFGAAFLLWELSTPMVHLRWVLHKSGRADSRLYLANGLAMVAVFFLCRPVWGTYMSYRFFQDTQVELEHPRPNGFPSSGIWGYRIANVALNALNYVWFYKMASKALSLLMRPSGSKSTGSKPGSRQKVQ